MRRLLSPPDRGVPVGPPLLSIRAPSKRGADTPPDLSDPLRDQTPVDIVPFLASLVYRVGGCLACKPSSDEDNVGSKRSEPPSKQERAQRRRDDRDRLRRAAQQLLTREGWMCWVLTRATLTDYSAINCMLLAAQCHERGVVPQRVHGLHSWRKLGRRVRKGETALRISAPMTFCEFDENGCETGERRLGFRTAFVFELSQTEPVPGIKANIQPSHGEPLSGDTHATLLVPLQAFAILLGYSVSFQITQHPVHGWHDAQRRQIAVDARASANTQVRILIHECVHALAIDYRHYSKAQAEVIADAVTFVACASVGLTIATDSVPYVASWGKDGALDAVTAFARTIDELARRIEDGPLQGYNEPSGL